MKFQTAIIILVISIIIGVGIKNYYSEIPTRGGFGHDFDLEDSLLKEFVPDKMNFPTINEKRHKK